MAITYEPIATTTLSGTATSITFSSIPNTYTDLVVSWTALASTASYQPAIRFNGDNGANYNMLELWGDGTSPSFATERDTSYINAARGSSLSTTIPEFTEFNIFSYAGSTYKTAINKYAGDNNGSGVIEITVGLWRSTAAINSLTLVSANGAQSLAAGTIATLYGIRKA
jgi:hypothetical protein